MRVSMPLTRRTRISLGPLGLLIYVTVILPGIAAIWLAVAVVYGAGWLAVRGCRAIAARRQAALEAPDPPADRRFTDRRGGPRDTAQAGPPDRH
jgi:hypothetical protein